MSNQRNVLAYTAPGSDMPEFVSINIETELKIATVIVRSPKSLDSVTAQVTLNLYEWRELVDKMTKTMGTLIS
jgi:hypothetical protein